MRMLIVDAMALDLTLRPNRSLDRRHARWLILAVGAVFLLFGLRLLAVGAWPVVPFLAVDIGLLAWAFRASYRSGRAFQTVRLDDAALTVRDVSASGSARSTRLESYFARARLEALPAEQNRLWLASRGRSVEVGQCLSPPERVEVHGVIDRALRSSRSA